MSATQRRCRALIAALGTMTLGHVCSKAQVLGGGTLKPVELDVDQVIRPVGCADV